MTQCGPLTGDFGRPRENILIHGR